MAFPSSQPAGILEQAQKQAGAGPAPPQGQKRETGCCQDGPGGGPAPQDPRGQADGRPLRTHRPGRRTDGPSGPTGTKCTQGCRVSPAVRLAQAARDPLKTGRPQTLSQALGLTRDEAGGQ